MNSSRICHCILGSVAGAALALLVPACVADVTDDPSQGEEVDSAEEQLIAGGVGSLCGFPFGPCDEGLTCCYQPGGGRCRDLLWDEHNCGSCGYDCSVEGDNYCELGVSKLIGE
jgi:hypothetical protein